MPTYETTVRYAIIEGWRTVGDDERRTIEATVTASNDCTSATATSSQKTRNCPVGEVTRDVVASARRLADEMLAAAEAAMSSTP